MELIEDGVIVDLEYIGEGWSGEYNAQDPDDTPLLRFDVRLENPDPNNPDYPDDASYCTRLPADLSDEVKAKACRVIMDAVKSDVLSRSSIKRRCEELSWLQPADLT